MRFSQPAWKIRTESAKGGAPSAPATPTNSYVAEDGSTNYVAEDGTTFYVDET